MLSAVEGAKLDPIEEARQRLARVETASRRTDDLPPLEDLDGDFEAELPDEDYQDGLVSLLQAVRSLRDRGLLNAHALGLHSILDGIEKARRQLRPGICSECGCTESTACIDERGEPCGWSDQSETLCTACAESDGTR